MNRSVLATAALIMLAACSDNSNSTTASTSPSAPASSVAASSPQNTSPAATIPVVTDPTVDTATPPTFDASCLQGDWIGGAQRMQHFVDQLIPADAPLAFVIGADSAWRLTITGEDMATSTEVTVIYTTPEGDEIRATGSGTMSGPLLVTSSGRVDGWVTSGATEVWSMTATIGGQTVELPVNPQITELDLARLTVVGTDVACESDTLKFVNPDPAIPPIILDRA